MYRGKSATPSYPLSFLIFSVSFLCVIYSCLHNVISMFHALEKELLWRKEHGIPEGFDTLRKSRPLVAIGAIRPLEDQPLASDFFRELDVDLCFSTGVDFKLDGLDGLCGIHTSV